MKIFLVIRKNLTKSGHCAEHSPLAIELIPHLLKAFSAVISLFMYVFYVANSVEEFMLSFYMLTSGVGILISFLNTLFKMTEMFNLIESLQRLTNESE